MIRWVIYKRQGARQHTMPGGFSKPNNFQTTGDSKGLMFVREPAQCMIPVEYANNQTCLSHSAFYKFQLKLNNIQVWHGLHRIQISTFQSLRSTNNPYIRNITRSILTMNSNIKTHVHISILQDGR